MFLDNILKGLVLWLYGLILEGVEYMADSLLNIFSLDLAYFETYAPVVREIQNIVIAVGWALLIGNLVFQAMRSMAAGLGFEGEDDERKGGLCGLPLRQLPRPYTAGGRHDHSPSFGGL